MKGAYIFVFGAILLGLARPGRVEAVDFPSFVNRGAVQYATSTAITVSTNPALVYSTGTGIFQDYAHLPGPQAVVKSSPTAGMGLTISTAAGQYMADRIYLEFFNDTSTDVWVGYTSKVSTSAGADYGRRLIPGSAYAIDGAIRDVYAVASSSWGQAANQGQFETERKFVITQAK